MEDKHKNMEHEKEAFLAELRKADDPEQMSWLMANFLMDKIKGKMHDNKPEYKDDQRYGHTWDSRYASPYGRGFNGAMYSDNSSRRSRKGESYSYFSKEEMDSAKERLGVMLGRTLSEDDIKCLICKEAASIIKRICKDEAFEAMKEFSELCIAMKAYSELLPEELEIQAKEEAIGKYMEMFSHRERYGHSSFRMRLMHEDDTAYSPVRRIRLDDMDRHGMSRLPLVEVDEFNYRGRSRDSMGRYK